MKKKMLTVLLAAAMTVSLAGCGSKDADKKTMHLSRILKMQRATMVQTVPSLL